MLPTVELLVFDLQLRSYLWGDTLKEYKCPVLHQIFTTSFSISDDFLILTFLLYVVVGIL